MIIELPPILDIKYKSIFLSEQKRDEVLNDSIFIFLPRDKSRKIKFFFLFFLLAIVWNRKTSTYYTYIIGDSSSRMQLQFPFAG